MKPLFITWHLGLGDAIICAAIVAKYASERSQVSVPCYHHNLVSVKSFFVNLPNVTVVPVKDEQEMLAIRDQSSPHFEIMNLGFYAGKQPEGIAFDDWFYIQSGMDIKTDRVKWCPIAEAAKKVNQLTTGIKEGIPYTFFHQDSERGFHIPYYMLGYPTLIYTPQRSEAGVLAFAEIIKNASEIHVIDSSFLHLCESLPTTGKLVWHKYARSTAENLKLNKEWKIIK